MCIRDSSTPSPTVFFFRVLFELGPRKGSRKWYLCVSCMNKPIAYISCIRLEFRLRRRILHSPVCGFDLYTVQGWIFLLLINTSASCCRHSRTAISTKSVSRPSVRNLTTAELWPESPRGTTDCSCRHWGIQQFLLAVVPVRRRPHNYTSGIYFPIIILPVYISP